VKIVIAAFAGAIVAVAAYILLGLPTRRAAPTVATTTPAVAVAQPLAPPASPAPSPLLPAPASAAPSTLALPPKLRQTIDDELAQLHSERDVEAYLHDLEARARRQGRVTAFEIEPGIAAIQRLVAPERVSEQIGQYAQRMGELSQKLDGRSEAAPADLPALAHRIDHAGDEGARQALIREYLDGTFRLPPDQQAAALQRLTVLDPRPGAVTSKQGEIP
jgi:hypothetical protein